MKKALSVLIAIACSATFAGCSKPAFSNHRLNQLAGYVMELRFDTTVGQYTFFMSHYLDNYCDDIVLVTSDAESGGYPDGVIVAWPSEETEQILLQLNWYIDHKQMDLAPYSLTYPLTVEKALENWEGVKDFLENGLTSSERDFLTNPYEPLFKLDADE